MRGENIESLYFLKFFDFFEIIELLLHAFDGNLPGIFDRDSSKDNREGSTSFFILKFVLIHTPLVLILFIIRCNFYSQIQSTYFPKNLPNSFSLRI